MGLYSLFPIAAAILISSCVAMLLSTRIGVTPISGRYATIDGLRGYLALFVFLHHACIWFVYLKGGDWVAPDSNLYAHLGKGSVALFFMITGFLFFNKILVGRKVGIDWKRLYVSRFLRLVPLYMFAMVLMFLIVGYKTGFQLNESVMILLKHVGTWIAFSLYGQPEINGLKDTFIIVAGVSWSLPYEWFFYALLPLMALLLGARVKWLYICVGLVGVYAVLHICAVKMYMLSFFGGIAASFLVLSKPFCSFARSKLSTALIVAALSVIVYFYRVSYELVPHTLLAVVFCLVAGGNDLLGVLTARASRALGEMAYGIYLLHGIFLYFTFEILMGAEFASKMSVFEHWLTIIAIVPFLITFCAITFVLIERPCIRKVSSASSKISLESILRLFKLA